MNELDWKLVTQEIPENRQRVLCYNGFRIVDTRWEMCTDQDEEWFRRKFTHWCNLPNLPNIAIAKATLPESLHTKP